jgi:hypothetical protein
LQEIRDKGKVPFITVPALDTVSEQLGIPGRKGISYTLFNRSRLMMNLAENQEKSDVLKM